MQIGREEDEENQLIYSPKKPEMFDTDKSTMKEPKKNGTLLFFGQGILICFLFLLVFGVLIVSIGSIILFAEIDNLFKNNIPCGNSCKFSLVESIPDQIDLQRPEGVLKTNEVFKKLILESKFSVKIGSFYWTLNNTRQDAGGNIGNEILESIYEAKRKNPNLKIEIIQQSPLERFPNEDTKIMFKSGIISNIVNIDLSKIFNGGVQHSKFLISDNRGKILIEIH